MLTSRTILAIECICPLPKASTLFREVSYRAAFDLFFVEAFVSCPLEFFDADFAPLFATPPLFVVELFPPALLVCVDPAAPRARFARTRVAGASLTGAATFNP